MTPQMSSYAGFRAAYYFGSNVGLMPSVVVRIGTTGVMTEPRSHSATDTAPDGELTLG